MRAKKYAEADTGRCVACGACMMACPKGAIRVWRGSYAVVDRESCVGCGLCARTCPADCISLKEREELA